MHQNTGLINLLFVAEKIVLAKCNVYVSSMLYTRALLLYFLMAVVVVVVIY